MYKTANINSDYLEKLRPLSTYWKVHTFKSLLRSIALGPTTAVAKVGPGRRDAPSPPAAHQLNVSDPLIFIKPHNVFHLLSQLTRLKVMPHPAIPPVKLFSSLETVYRMQLHKIDLTPIAWWPCCAWHDDLHDTINCPQIAICSQMVNHHNKHTVIHFATVLLKIIMFIHDVTSPTVKTYWSQLRIWMCALFNTLIMVWVFRGSPNLYLQFYTCKSVVLNCLFKMRS